MFCVTELVAWMTAALVAVFTGGKVVDGGSSVVVDVSCNRFHSSKPGRSVSSGVTDTAVVAGIAGTSISTCGVLEMGHISRQSHMDAFDVQRTKGGPLSGQVSSPEASPRQASE